MRSKGVTVWTKSGLKSLPCKRGAERKSFLKFAYIVNTKNTSSASCFQSRVWFKKSLHLNYVTFYQPGLCFLTQPQSYHIEQPFKLFVLLQILFFLCHLFTQPPSFHLKNAYQVRVGQIKLFSTPVFHFNLYCCKVFCIDSLCGEC